MSYTPLHLQNFLRAGGTLDELKEKYAIKTRSHRDYPNLIHFKYDQLDSPFAEPLVQECRGIILDRDNDWVIISRAFNKFFNHGEGHAANIDYKTAKVLEKLDGSLCVLYHYDNKWHTATTGTAEGSGDVGPNRDLTFSDYFFQTWQQMVGQPFDAEPGFSYYFELMGPLNRVVVAHKKASLAMLGARNLYNQNEMSASHAISNLIPAYYNDGIEIPYVKEFSSLTTVAEITDSFDKIDPTCQEGYVVVDANFNRIKIKHPGYVALHHMLSKISTKAFVEIARSGETSEVCNAFPEYKPMLDEAKGRFEELVLKAETEYEKYKDIENQKDFAMAIKKIPYSGVLFGYRAKKIDSIRHGFKATKLENLLTLLGYKEDKSFSKDID